MMAHPDAVQQLSQPLVGDLPESLNATLVRCNAELVRANAELARTNALLVQKTFEQAQQLQTLLAELAAIKEHRDNTTGANHLPADLTGMPHAAAVREADVSIVARYCMDAVKEISEKEKKRNNLAILGFPESATSADTEKTDLLLAEKIAESCGVQKGDIAQVFRHGAQRGGKPRTLKLLFQTPQAPDRILAEMRRKRLYSTLLPLRCRIRRDLTSSEQLKERDARREAYRLNSEANAYMWTVNDNFEVIRLASAREWRRDTATRDQ